MIVDLAAPFPYMAAIPDNSLSNHLEPLERL